MNNNLLAIGFAEWLNIEAYRDGEHEWKYRGDNYARKHSTQEMLDIFTKK